MTLVPNMQRHIFEVIEHIRCLYPKHHDPLRSQPGVTSGIMCDLLEMIMKAAIYLNCELRRGAVEIQYIGSCRVLASKL